MTVIILRRPKLGRATKEVVRMSECIDAVVRNDHPIPPNVDMVFRWGTTSNVACNNVVNTAEAIHRVNDKAGFRRTLMDDWAVKGRQGLPLCPHTYFENGQGPVQQADFPVVVRPRVHAQGRHVYLCRDLDEMATAVRRCGPGFYISKFIDKVAEYRVMFAQGRVVWVAKKTPGNPQDVAWNVARGGRFDNVRWDEWPLKAVRISREAFLLSGLNFGAVDVMVDAAGEAYVLEINSAPSQTSPYRQKCTAKAFDYIVRNGKADIPITEARGGYKKFIHPSICQESVIVARG